MPRVAKDKAKRTKKKLNKTEQENTKTNTKDLKNVKIKERCLLIFIYWTIMF